MEAKDRLYWRPIPASHGTLRDLAYKRLRESLYVVRHEAQDMTCHVMIRPVMATACKGEVLFWRREERVVMIQSDGGETERIQIEAHLGLESGHRIFPCAPEANPLPWKFEGTVFQGNGLDSVPPAAIACVPIVLNRLVATIICLHASLRMIPAGVVAGRVEPLA